MAGAKKAQKNEKEVKEYKLLNGEFKSKDEANRKVLEAKEKGFVGTRLVLVGSCYKVQFAEYWNKETAEKSLEVVKAAGFEVQLVED